MMVLAVAVVVLALASLPEPSVGHKPGCVCLQNYDPVCGSDGRTYSNLCSANCHDVTQLDCVGECPCGGSSCACPLNYSPVCGSNDKTYANTCLAECDGVNAMCDRQCPCNA